MTRRWTWTRGKLKHTLTPMIDTDSIYHKRLNLRVRELDKQIGGADEALRRLVNKTFERGAGEVNGSGRPAQLAHLLQAGVEESEILASVCAPRP